MSLIWADSFDHYGTTPNGGRDAMLSGAWAGLGAGTGTAPAVSSAQARTGTYSLAMAYNNLGTHGILARRVLGSAQLVVGCALGIYFNSLPDDNKEHGFEFRDNTNACIAFLAVQSDGAIGFYIGSTRTLYASTDPIITATSWQHIEAKLTVDDIVGAMEVRVNGVTVLHETDLNLGALGCTQIAFGMPAGKAAGGNLTYYLDDIVTWNDVGDGVNDFIGACRVETLFPVADTAQADWLLFGDTDGFDCIDNVPPDGDTTYLSSANAGDTSEFGLPTLPPETADIKGVYIPTMAKLVAAGTGNIQASLVSGADVSLGPDQTLTTAYTYWGGSHELDPATDAAWTKSGLEAALLRVEKTV